MEAAELVAGFNFALLASAYADLAWLPQFLLHLYLLAAGRCWDGPEFAHHALTALWLPLWSDWRIVAALGFSQLLWVRRRELGKVPLLVFRLVLCPAYLLCWPEASVNYVLAWVATGYVLFRAASALASAEPRMWLFRLLGWLQGVTCVQVTDMHVLGQVMKASEVKGFALERHIACPAWLPVRSLESIDGAEWRVAHARMVDLLTRLPPPGRLAECAAEALARAPRPLDASAISRYAIEALLAYVFEVAWEERFEIFVEASWEWRKEIAVKGCGDQLVKARAVAVLLDLLRASDLWGLHGEAWAEPELYSLVAQPLLISPAINVSDIAVTLVDHPELGLDDLLRAEHPFPVFERYLAEGLQTQDSRGRPVEFAPGTQVLAFLDTNREPYAWSPFGLGARRCMGRDLTVALIEPLRAAVADLEPRRGHRFSGRHNDAVKDWGMHLYFARTVASVLWRARHGRE